MTNDSLMKVEKENTNLLQVQIAASTAMDKATEPERDCHSLLTKQSLSSLVTSNTLDTSTLDFSLKSNALISVCKNCIDCTVVFGTL